MVSITTTVDVDFDDFDDEDLIVELVDRGYYVSGKDTSSNSYNIEDLYEAWIYKTGNF